MGNISFYQGKKEIFSSVQRTRRFQAVDAANDGKRATMIDYCYIPLNLIIGLKCSQEVKRF